MTEIGRMDSLFARCASKSGEIVDFGALKIRSMRMTISFV